MANKIKRDKKNTIRFVQTADAEIYKTFYTRCKNVFGISVQDRIRLLMANDSKPDQLGN